MGIQNFPAALQPIIQQNFLEREFQDGLESMLGYRQIADRESFPNRIGESVIKSRPGLKAPITTPVTPSNNTNLDNGMTPSSWTIEQYTLAINQYQDTIDLNIIADHVGLASQFLQNAKVNGVQAAQSLDRIARNKLFDAHLGGNTRVRTTLGAAAATISVDDIRGFQNAMSNGAMSAVSGSNTMPVTVGASVYTLTAAAADATNVSTAPNGISGTLTFSAAVTVSDGTAGNAVVGTYAPTILRPNGRATTAALTASDLLTMGLVLDGVAQLRNNAVPTIDGYYNVYLDNRSARQLFADQDFKLLFQGQSTAQEFRQGRVVELLDCRFIPTTEAFQQSLGGINIRRPIICGQGALIEGDFEGMAEALSGDSTVSIIDGVAQVTREPLDRNKQIIAQSWYWIGGFCVPTDATATQSIIPTASQAYHKRAVVLETA